MNQKINEKNIRLLLEIEDKRFSDVLYSLPNTNLIDHMLKLMQSGLLESPAHVHERAYPITPQVTNYRKS